MDPYFYVREEFDNVVRALDDTLRHDYGPGQTEDYYTECNSRLKGIKARLDTVAQVDDEQDKRSRLSNILAELSDLANRLALIERSRLGEFSWPFADIVRQISAGVLSDEPGLFGPVQPIIHVIAEGTGYQIRNEQVLGPSKQRRLVTVAFPRQLKHHVLMHAIFGHEIGHAAFYSTQSKPICRTSVLPILQKDGPLSTHQELTTWLTSASAPPDVSKKVSAGGGRLAKKLVENWVLELTCDLFGLRIFGLPFAAAHRALLEPATRTSFDFDPERSTHPPFSVRRRILVKAIRLLKWDQPITQASDGLAHKAELALLDYALEDTGSDWLSIVSDENLKNALTALEPVFQDKTLLAARPERDVLVHLIDRLRHRLPPIFETLEDTGVANFRSVSADHCLYAGWAYWFGREEIHGSNALDFFDVNRLCDLALLQQQAVERILAERSRTAA